MAEADEGHGVTFSSWSSSHSHTTAAPPPTSRRKAGGRGHQHRFQTGGVKVLAEILLRFTGARALTLFRRVT